MRLDLERLDPASEDERIFLLEALHPDFDDALRDDEEMVVAAEPVSPRLHITLHQIVASQLLADNPPETWQTVQRLAALGYDWHNIMHMIARLVSEDICHATSKQQPFDPGDYCVACEKCMIAHGAEIDWDQPGHSPYDRTHAEL